MSHKNHPYIKGKKLVYKYLSIITSVVLLSVLIIGSTYVFISASYWNNEQINTLNNTVEIVADSSQSILSRVSSSSQPDDVDFKPLEMICNTLDTMSSAIGADIFVANMNGEVVVCREMMNKQYHFDRQYNCPIHNEYIIDSDIIKQASENRFSEVGNMKGLFTEKHITSAFPIKINGKTVAIAIASEAITASRSGYTRKNVQIFSVAAILSVIFSFVAAFILSYKMTKPLRQMSIATQHYSQGDFSYKVQVKGSGELAQLSQAFNNMAMSLSELESSRRNFVANVSHELKTPMTSIGGFIDGILDGTIKEDKYEHYLQIVSDEIKRLSRLVTGMLNMSKLEAGEMSINPKTFDISADIFKTLLSFEKKINDKSIEILGLDSMKSMSVSADEDMMLQVIYNLIDNAVKFTPQNGYIEIKNYKDENRIFVSIKNSGAGIEKQEADKIFERFYKIDKSRSYDVKGAGLGLYLVKNIIELHGGQIKVISKVGEFTEFVFWIPNV